MVKKRYGWITVSLFLLIAGCGDSYGSENLRAEETNENSSVENEPAETAEKDWFDDIRETSAEYFNEADFETVLPEDVYNDYVFNSEDSGDELIVDVRDMNAFTEGNIPHSVNVPFGQSGNYQQVTQLPKDRELIVVCFSGHTASQFAGMLNTLGYDAKPLQYGMGGYTSDEDHGAAIPEEAEDFPTVTEGFEAEESYEHSEIMYDEDKALDEVILGQSASFLDKEMPNVIPAPEVQEIIEDDSFEDHQLIDIRTEDHYDSGHLEKAVSVPYSDLFSEAGLSQIDPDRTAIIVGYNGHDASQASRALNHLNIEAVPMMFGMSIWSDDEELLGDHQFTFDEMKTYPVKPLQYDPDAEETEAGCS